MLRASLVIVVDQGRAWDCFLVDVVARSCLLADHGDLALMHLTRVRMLLRTGV